MVYAVFYQRDLWWCGESVAVLHHQLKIADDHTNTQTQIYLVAPIFVHTIFSISVLYDIPSWAHASTWTLAVVLESMYLVVSIAIYPYEHRAPTAGDSDSDRKRKELTRWAAVEIALNVLRIIFLLALVFSYAIFVTPLATKYHSAKMKQNGSPCEPTHLLNPGVGNDTIDGRDYGSALEDATRQIVQWGRPEIVPSISWWQYFRGYSLFLPYIWPAKSLKLQITALFCLILVFVGRAVNVLIPHQVSVIVNIFSRESGGSLEVLWGEICLFALYCLLQGLLSSIRSLLWIPISEIAYKKLSMASFEHVHKLSLDFHLEKKTGEVLSALNKGNSINKFLDRITFQVLPCSSTWPLPLATYLLCLMRTMH